jgi:WD40 repeat protein
VRLSPNGRLLASGSYDKTVRVWDTSTGALQHTLEVGRIATTFEISDDSLFLSTDLGSFSIPTNVQSGFDNITSYSPSEDGNTFVQENRWIIMNGKKTLWLPAECRPTCSAVKDGIVALGHASGQVSFICIARESSLRTLALIGYKG